MSPSSHDFITACALLHMSHKLTLLCVFEVLYVKMSKSLMDKLTNHKPLMDLVMCLEVFRGTLAIV